MALWNPLYIAYDPGLQLSAVATLGLILLSPVIEKKLEWVQSVFVRDIVATTLAAQIFVLPLLLYQTGNLSIVSVVANVITMPVIPAAMLLSFIAALISLIVPVVGSSVGAPAYILLAYVIRVAQEGAKLPFANVILPEFPFVLVVSAYVFLGWCIYKAKRAETLPRPVPPVHP
jgi:competence protein ComEC